MSFANYVGYDPSNPAHTRQGRRLWRLLQIHSYLKYNDVADATQVHEWMGGVNSSINYKSDRKDAVAFNLFDEIAKKKSQSGRRYISRNEWII